MISRDYNEISLKRVLFDNFGIDIDISQFIVNRVPVSHTAEATLFLNSKKQLYVYISNPSKLILSDVKKMVSRMGLKAELYMPPKNRPQYFNEVAISKFREVFPGRKQVNDDDLIFYRTLVPYNPALVLISEVVGSEVYRFDSDSSSSWRVAARFTYRRIRTS